MRERGPFAVYRYLVAVAATTVVAFVRLLLSPVLGDVASFMPFSLAVVVASWYGGLGPGVLATALSAPLGLYLSATGTGALGIGISQVTALALFVFTNLAVAWLCGRLHHTQRRLKAEQARLRGSHDFQAAIAELSADFGYDVRLQPDGPALLEGVTEGFGRVLGYELEELNALGGWSQLIHPDDLPSFQRRDALPPTAGREEGETRMLAKDGRVVWVRYSNRAVTDERGRVVRLIGAARDVTERKRAEDALRTSEERYRSLAAATTAVVWTTDAAGGFVEPQASWEHYTGQAWEQHRGWGWLEALHPDDREGMKRLQAQALANRSPFETAARLWHAPSACYRLCESRGVPLFDREGRPKEWIGTCVDVEDRRRAEESLRESDRRKDEFLAILAHELRNPLAPLRTVLAGLAADGDAELSARVRSMMERQLEVLVRLVDDLLDVSRITRGRLELRRERVEVGAVLAQAVETVRPLLDAARQELVITAPEETLVVHADSVRLAQVVANLLNNASKYSSAGSRIWLRVERHDGELALAVKDSGAGISREMLPRVFELFVQQDRSLERAQGGLGIGLTLVQRLVELHGGTVSAHSEGPGKGSEFVVCLPLAAGPAVAEPTAPAKRERPRAPARRILVVDDNRDAADSLAGFLHLAGHETRTAYEGGEAVRTVEAFEPEVVLLDIGLPAMNGYDVASRIRALPEGARPLLVAVTGWGQTEDRRRSEQAGFDLHLVKPVDPRTLDELLEAAWRARAG